MTEELFPTQTPIDVQPLAARLAPQKLEDFAGQEALLGPGKMLRRLIAAGKFSSALFFGPPGSGKTALARFIARLTNAGVVELNAVAAGVADLKKVLEQARYDLSAGQKRTLLLVDEIHHFNRTQQDVLLPASERGDVLLIGLTTENPSFYVNAALLSRITAFEFMPLSPQDLRKIVARALADKERGLGRLNLDISAEAAAHLIAMSGGDARKLLNALELAALSTAPDVKGRRRISLEIAEESISRRSIRYDKRSDDHYDHISAFIKSMRGSDPDAALYWMAKMLAAGEDPRFIARRILICAAEDVGLADFRALLVAQAAFSAVEFLGMPEARIPLAQAVIFIAAAPKSNSAYLAIDAALQEAQKGPSREVLPHLRDANLDGKTRGHGIGYQYPHDFPNHYTPQQYMPQPLRFYQPLAQGDEKRIKEFLNNLGRKAAMLMMIAGLAAAPAQSAMPLEAIEPAEAASSASRPLPLDKIGLPSGFAIELYTDRVPGARSMALSDNGVLYVGTRSGGVYAVTGGTVAAQVLTIASRLNEPNGVAWRDGSLYVAEISRILRYDDIDSRLNDPPEPVVVKDDLPSDKAHGWKFIRFGPDKKLYVPVGAPCNVCKRPAPYGSILRMNSDGSGIEVFAQGVRNTVGFDWHPATKELWFTENGRDWLGDMVPPDELNRASSPRLHFGFPYCHGKDIMDPEFGKERSCHEFEPPAFELPAHVAALGMRFYTGNLFPEKYRGQIFIAEHGSWNRTKPIGYRIALVRLQGNQAYRYEIFAEGWLQEKGAWGRPVDVQMLKDGSLLVSDDKAGAIYHITYVHEPDTLK